MTGKHSVTRRDVLRLGLAAGTAAVGAPVLAACGSGSSSGSATAAASSGSGSATKGGKLVIGAFEDGALTPFKNTIIPLFEKATVRLRGPYRKGPFTVIARNQSPANKYVQSATLDGRPLREPFIRHADIANGSTLVFQMGPRPNKSWGARGAAARTR